MMFVIAEAPPKVYKELFENQHNFAVMTNHLLSFNKRMRIDKNINVLRQMKLIIDTQFGNLNKNIKIINGIQNDLNQLNRYGKIK